MNRPYYEHEQFPKPIRIKNKGERWPAIERFRLKIEVFHFGVKKIQSSEDSFSEK
jgi:hypothetical protein